MDDQMFFLELDFGKLGREWQGQSEWTRRNVVDFVISGELGRTVSVLEVHEGRAVDITEDIAREIADRFYADREQVSWELQNFIETHAGVAATRGLNILEAAE